MLEKSDVSKTVKASNKMIDSDLMVFNNIIQRAYVWGKPKQSELIYSVLYGYPIPLIYAKTIQDGKKIVFDVLDGQQRLKTLFNYCSNGFALDKLKNRELKYEENGEEKKIDLIGKKFKDLPEVLQDRILDTSLKIVKFDNITVEEERELFMRLNNGQQLSVKSRNNLNCIDIDNIYEIGNNHENLFSEKGYGLLSKKSFENKEYISLLMKMWEMLFVSVKDISFESKNFNSLVRETIISEEERVELEEFLDYMYNVRVMSLDLVKEEDGALTPNARKKFNKETHYISLVPFMNFARKHNIEDAEFCKFINHFYSTEETTSISEQYNNACQSGNAKNSNIIARHNALKEEFEKFFGVEYEEVERTEVVKPVTEPTGQLEQLEDKEHTEEVTEPTEATEEVTEPTTESETTENEPIEEQAQEEVQEETTESTNATEDFMNTPEPENESTEENTESKEQEEVQKKSKRSRKRK